MTSPLCSQLTDLPQIQFQAQVLIPDQIKKYLGEFWFKNVHQARLLWHVKALLKWCSFFDKIELKYSSFSHYPLFVLNLGTPIGIGSHKLCSNGNKYLL